MNRCGWFGLLVWVAAIGSACTTPPPVAPPTPDATPTPFYYTVQAGDTLTGIAARFGLDPALLALVNELDNPDLLRPGQQLLISDRVTVSGRVLPTATPTPLPCLQGCREPPPDCRIKAFYARLDGLPLYVVPGDVLYPRIEAERWFCREEDARTAGWVRWTPWGPATPTPSGP